MRAATSWAFVVDGDFGSTTSTGLRRYSVNELGLLRAGMMHTDRYGSSGARCLIVENTRVEDDTERVANMLSDAAHFPSHSAPATPENAPETTKAMSWCRRTSMPMKRARRGFSRMARSA